MADAEVQQLHEQYRQAKTKSRAAEAFNKFAQSNHIQRLSEREAAHRTEDYFRAQLRLHGCRADLEKGLRDAEFGLKTASGRVKATAEVAANADLAQKAANLATIAARQSLEDAKLAADRSRRPVEPQMRGIGKVGEGALKSKAQAACDWDRRSSEMPRQGDLDKQKADRKKSKDEVSRLEEAERRKREELSARQDEAESKNREQIRSLMEERRIRHEIEQRQEEASSSRMREQHQQRQRDQAAENAADRERERDSKRKEYRKTYDRRQGGWQRSQANAGSGSNALHDSPQFAHTLWKKSVERAFSDYAGIKVFPEPPVTGKCTKPACEAAKGQRALKACACDVEAAFTLLKLSLKEARLAWHPDRFSKCSPEHLESFQGKAKEVFQVVMSMYSKTKDNT